MSRFSLDPPDDDAYDVRDDADCADCGRPSVAWLCETCSDQREAWAAATELRLTAAMHIMQERSAVVHTIPVVDVALVPVSDVAGVVEVALVPIMASVRVLSSDDARDLKRMARAFLAADLSNVKDVA